MSSNISQRMAKEIQDEVSRLLGRGRTTFECPLDGAQRAALWHEMLGADKLKAFGVLQTHGYDLSYHRVHEVAFDSYIEGQSYNICLYNYDGYGCDHYFFKAGDEDDLYRSGERLAAAFPRPVEDWPEFVHWIQNTGRIEYEFSAALDTLEKLLEFCSTISQLTRAVPELAQYLSREKREILQGQKRASNMPFEWSTFDRSRIDVLQFSLAKAHLMPKKNNLLWNELDRSHATFVPHA